MKIGITCGFNAKENQIVLNKAYIEFAKSGAIRHQHRECSIDILYPTMNIESANIPSYDMLIFSGGPDINPILYGRSTIEADKCDFERDLFELKLLDIAFKNKIPTLGICRGAQMMGIYFGTSLKQDIDSHSQPHKREVPSHPIILNRLGKEILHTIGGECLVNSMHHQCVNLCVGEKNVSKFKDSTWGNEKLSVVGIAQDGVCEMFISKEFPKFLGVQWHEEELSKYNYGHSEAIFNYLLKE